MIVLGLDNKEYEWKPRGSTSLDNKSGLHNKVKELLSEIFPYDIILEEVELIGSRDFKGKKELCADFYIPNRQMIIEAHGEQHYTKSSLFHKKNIDFKKAQKRDNDKIRWCDQNNIKLVVLDHKDKPEKWREQIERARRS